MTAGVLQRLESHWWRYSHHQLPYHVEPLGRTLIIGIIGAVISFVASQHLTNRWSFPIPPVVPLLLGFSLGSVASLLMQYDGVHALSERHFPRNLTDGNYPFYSPAWFRSILFF